MINMYRARIYPLPSRSAEIAVRTNGGAIEGKVKRNKVNINTVKLFMEIAITTS